MRNLEFVTGEYYHIYNRGTDKRVMFLNDNDFKQFLESLHLFNDAFFVRPTKPIYRAMSLSLSERFDFERNHLVDVCAFTLIPNHFHLQVKQIKDGGISKLLHKLDMGYSKYFNYRKDRSGTLYEGEFKAVHVENDEHLKFLPVYIHLNVLDLFGIPWRDGLVEDWDKALELLASYRWTSHGAYIGEKQYLPIIKEETMRDFYLDADDYLDHIRGWSQRSIHENWLS